MLLMKNRKKTNNETNRIAISGISPTVWRKGKFQVFWYTESSYHQTCRDEKLRKKMSTTDERERLLNPSAAAGITSKGLTLGFFIL